MNYVSTLKLKDKKNGICWARKSLMKVRVAPFDSLFLPFSDFWDMSGPEFG